MDAVGPNVDGAAPGDRVACSFIMPCGACGYCVRGREDLCETFFAYNRLKGQLYDGSTRLYRPNGEPVAMYSMGGLAEYAVTPATSVFPLPESVPLNDAAIIGCSIFTAYGAVRNQADVRPGQSVAVFAVGGVGTQVLQMARGVRRVSRHRRGHTRRQVGESAGDGGDGRRERRGGGRSSPCARTDRRARRRRRGGGAGLARHRAAGVRVRPRWREGRADRHRGGGRRGSAGDYAVRAARRHGSSAPTARRRGAICRRSSNSRGGARWT